jgi:MoaA/NifB/PqqE/SkfB family radical SAM enzyme
MRDSAENWATADLNVEALRRIAPYFNDVESVVLEGWGEPLLYPDLVEAIGLVKGAGARAGFVTSGWGLTRDYIEDLLSARVDFMGFSLSGATAATHNAIRVNSEFPEVVQAMAGLVRAKRDRHQELPGLHIVFLMVRDNMREVVPLVDLASEIGITEVVLINLIQVTSAWQDGQRVFLHGEEEYEALLEEAEARARAREIELRRPSLSCRDVAVCDENPLRNVYISVDGEVAPCVYLNPPTSSPFRRIFCGREYLIDKVGFGNILQEDFATIWESPKYVEFRNCWQAKKRWFAGVYSPLSWGVPRRGAGGGASPLPPTPCQSCYKSVGL